MVLFETGRVKGHCYIAGLSSYPVHLIDSEKPVLVDGGAACGKALYVDDVRSVLGDREPGMLVISHVHWDHCGAVSHLKKAFPSLVVAASERAAEIIKRPRAIELMDRLNRGACSTIASFPGVDAGRLVNGPFEPFEVDLVLHDGQVFDLGGNLSLEVLATPGHTRDHMSFYIPEEKILFAAEASGCLDATGRIITQFLFDYDAYFASLTRLAALPAEVLCQGHRMVFVGRDEVSRFFERSLEAAVRFKGRVDDLLLEEGGSVDKVVERIKAEQYDTNTGIKQTEGAYLLNLRAQVAHLAAKAGFDR